eukprot:TRINITY_DN16982_c0_g1_i1.p1 TRINITY_DN16982_c0_g1~~TRINITY_DN16982_c0_g1_i1.p1  ORF type:complete len:231 (-),score=48.31 TRINITY_DN16982_c0_g1_i1:71-763(-)
MIQFKKKTKFFLQTTQIKINKIFFHNTIIMHYNDKNINLYDTKTNISGIIHHQYSKYLFQKGFNKIAKEEIERRNLFDTKKIEWENVIKEIDIEKEEIMSRNIHMIKDENSKGHLLMSSLIYAWYRVLNKNTVEQSKIMHLLKHCTSEQVSSLRAMLKPVEIAKSIKQDPLPILKKEIEFFSDAVLGDSFKLDFKESKNNYLYINVNKCFFHTFFIENDVSFFDPSFLCC